MPEHGQQMRVGGGMAQLVPQQVEHSRRTLRIDVLFVVPSGQLPLVLRSHHLEELDMTVEGLILVFT